MLGLVAVRTFAADIHGVVTDNARKPIRVAMISASKGIKLVARFSQADGRYEITLPSGTYDVAVKAYGYESKSLKTDAGRAVNTDFTMTPKFAVSQLSGAELEALLPDTPESRLLKVECVRCHSFTHVARRAGLTAAQWTSYLPHMTAPRQWGNPYAEGEFEGTTDTADRPDRVVALGVALEKYFGPKSPYFGPGGKPLTASDVKHVPLRDAVLSSTIYEYRVPTMNIGAHSIMADAQGNVWFSELQGSGNKVTAFNLASETFTEYPMPFPGSRPHTGVFGKDGIIWMPLSGAHNPPLASLDPKTGTTKTYSFPGFRAHTSAVDADGNIWITGSNFLKFDVKSLQFKEYKLPIPSGTEYNRNTQQGWHNLPGKPPQEVKRFTYDVRVDSKGMVWASNEALGLLFRLNPKTGETKTYTPPGAVSIKGVEIDGEDNVWFGVFWGSRVGKFDQKTENFTMYQPPTTFGMPYGLSTDKRTGNMWYADVNGNFISKLDPKTGKIDEYPIPSTQASARFPAVDPSGRVWFTEAMNDKIGYVDPGPKSGSGR